MEHYNHYPIIKIISIESGYCLLELSYFPSKKMSERSNILIREDHITEAKDYVLAHLNMIEKYSDEEISFEIGELEEFNQYRESQCVRNIGKNKIKENFKIKMNVNFDLNLEDYKIFKNLFLKLINTQEEKILEKIMIELDLMKRKKRECLIMELMSSFNKKDIEKEKGKDKI